MIPSSQPPPHNPYAAPGTSASDRPARPRVRVPGDDIKWVFAAFAGAGVPLRFLYYRWQRFGLSTQERDSVELVMFGVLFLGAVALWCWTYAAWSTVPLRNRVMHSPLGAVMRTVFPSPYWHILLQVRLCDGLDGALGELGIFPDAPKKLGALAGSALILPYVLMLFGIKLGFYCGIISDVVWFFYMFDCDATRRTLVEALAARRARELKEMEARAMAMASTLPIV
jgi:hypothetical protein